MLYLFPSRFDPLRAARALWLATTAALLVAAAFNPGVAPKLLATSALGFAAGALVALVSSRAHISTQTKGDQVMEQYTVTRIARDGLGGWYYRLRPEGGVAWVEERVDGGDDLETLVERHPPHYGHSIRRNADGLTMAPDGTWV